jgi:uncharacterized membrane protein required for colicin V production
MSTTAYTVIDIVIVLYLLVKFITGWRKGIVLSVLSLAGTFLCLFLAYQLCGTVSDQVSLYPESAVPFSGTLIGDSLYGSLNQIFWFFILFLIFRVVLLLVEVLVKALHHLPVIHAVSGLLGGLFGLVTGGIVLCLVCLLLHLPLFSSGTEIIDGTVLKYVNDTAETYALPYVEKYISLPDLSQISLSGDTGDEETGSDSLSEEEQDAVQSILEKYGISSLEDAEEIYSSLSEEEKAAISSWLSEQGITLPSASPEGGTDVS